MVSVCFYFQVHQPRRLGNYTVFDIMKNQEYFDETKNREVMEKVAKKCYLPMNQLLLELIQQHQGKFKVSFSISGTALEQMEAYAPEVLEGFKRLAATGCVEFLAETYYHSLSALYDKEEFKHQVAKHRARIKELFGQEPKVFRNTELIYNNEIAMLAKEMGFDAILAEGWDPILGWRSPNFVYKPTTADIKLLLKNYKLSDDIAFRFGNKSWEEYPLTVEKYEQWLSAINGTGDLVNLFMDYETFGEHQWEDTGIFEFMRHLPGALLRHPDNNFVTVSEATKRFEVRDELDIHHPISWADLERDTSAWVGNKMQQGALEELYKMRRIIAERMAAQENEVNDNATDATDYAQLLDLWRYLSTSDHFYYMCTKWFSDGDVHKYFNPYDSPYDSYIAFMNIMNDIAGRLAVHEESPIIISERPTERISSRT